ncbi:MAG: radical SAM protein [Acetobacteraceae bacterium]
MPDDARLEGGGSYPQIAVDEPVVVFGGCYSNLEATRALLKMAARLGVPPARMICTGDVIAYGADPSATLRLIRTSGIATVMGNCEESLATDAEDCGCGFVAGSVCERLSAAWFAHAAGRVGAADRRWMAELPRRIDLVLAGQRIAVVHGAPSRINRFLFASSAEAEFEAELARTGADGVIGGHCELPFTRFVGSRLWHNAGAIGMPANDGTPRGWFSLLVPEQREIEVRHLPLEYDFRSAAQATRTARLPEEYAEALESGLWPSFDILPVEEQAATGRTLVAFSRRWGGEEMSAPALPLHFLDPRYTATGEKHAQVELSGLEALWFNTGTLCNIACRGCYIESSPHSDRLIFLSRAEFERFLDDAARRHPELQEIGLTGGEPFMNPEAPGMIESALARGYRVLVLTNAMRPMQRHLAWLMRMRARHGARLALRVSLDHYTEGVHERVRGARSFAPALAGLIWLDTNGFSPAVAVRLGSAEPAEAVRAGFVILFREHRMTLDAWDPARLVLLPELLNEAEPPEVSEDCWRAFERRGRRVMCGSSRMVVHRRGEAEPRVVACTLQPWTPEFDLGQSLAEAERSVVLNHPYCSRFCVFGQASCSPRS